MIKWVIMKMIITKYLSLVLLFLVSCKTFENKIKKHQSDLYIGVYDCFYEDNLKILLNNTEVVNIEKLSSNATLGTTGFFIEYFLDRKEKGLMMINTKDTLIRKDIFINLENDIQLEVIRNGNSNKFKIKISESKKIAISGCSNDRKSTLISYFRKKRMVE